MMHRACIALLFVAVAAHAQHDHAAPSTPVTATSPHVPPDPPAHLPEPMTPAQMVSMMQMDDAAAFGSVTFDELEWREHDDAFAWKAMARYGGDYNALVLKTEGESASDSHSRNELLWDRAVARWWNLQAGIRYDEGAGPSRTWAAIGIEGLAPWWIDFEATLYIGDQGRSAVRLEARHDVRFTQRLLLQPLVEMNAYGKDDLERAVGSGLSDVTAGLRLRYEFNRQFAPYMGVHWNHLFGSTADLASAEGRDKGEVQFVAGLRAWF
jgi:copper resistance protein B